MASVRGLVALALCALWFAWGGPKVAAQLVEHQARARSTVDLRDVVMGLALAPRDRPGAVPEGDVADEVHALLVRALEQEAAKAEWPLRALGSLGAEGRAVAASTERGLLPRSRELPQVPGEVLAVVEALGRQVGSGAGVGVELAGPATAWPGATSQDVAWGVWAAVDAGVSDDEARGVLAAALVGMEAHHLQPDTLTDLVALLDERVLELGAAAGADPSIDVLEAYGPAALAAVGGR